MNLPWPVVLASASPRRIELLRQLVSTFSVEPADINEDEFVNIDPTQTARILAREKCFAIFDRFPNSLVIGGDTVVAYQEGDRWIQLAKPAGLDDAVRMLTTLGGRTHTVITGVCLRWPTGMSSFTDSSEVTFKPIGESEARNYALTGSPMDKAGAYGLQDESHNFVASIRGSISNIIGLPMERLQESLRSIK